MSNIVGQVRCECGRVAHVKRRSNGRKLAFKHCQKCGVDMTSNEERREFWLSTMQQNLGEFGEMLDKPKETGSTETIVVPDKNVVNESVDLVSDNSTDWTPDVEDSALIETKVVADEPKEESSFSLLNIGLIAVSILGVALGVKNSLNSGGQ